MILGEVKSDPQLKSRVALFLHKSVLFFFKEKKRLANFIFRQVNNISDHNRHSGLLKVVS